MDEGLTLRMDSNVLISPLVTFTLLRVPDDFICEVMGILSFHKENSGFGDRTQLVEVMGLVRRQAYHPHRVNYCRWRLPLHVSLIVGGYVETLQQIKLLLYAI